jgi:hypothetical protein
MSTPERILVIVLRSVGVIDLLAIGAVLMPQRLMALGHSWAGLGPFPDAAIVGYLARSASALYALHGALIVFISFDVRRYWNLIAFLAWAAIVHGIIIAGIDTAEGVPRWWTILETSCIIAIGLVILSLQHLAGPRRAGQRPPPEG